MTLKKMARIGERLQQVLHEDMQARFMPVEHEHQLTYPVVLCKGMTTVRMALLQSWMPSWAFQCQVGKVYGLTLHPKPLTQNMKAWHAKAACTAHAARG